MSRIQSSVGLVTGVNIESTVNQLMALNAIPRDRLATRNQSLQGEQIAVTELMTSVVSVQLTTDRLGQDSLFASTTPTSSNSAALSVRNVGSPTVGDYSFVPVRQAQSQQLTSSLLTSKDALLTDGVFTIHRGGFLNDTVSLDTLNGGQGVERGQIKITDRSGQSATIDLRFAQTAADVVDAINAAETIDVSASLEDGSFVLSDNSGATVNNLQVEEVGEGTTASGLGLAGISVASSSATGTSVLKLASTTALNTLLDGRGLELPTSGNALQLDLQDGTSIEFSTSIDSNTGDLGQLIDELNTAGEGKIEARIASDGVSIEIEDLTSGAETFSISSPSGSLASQLGLDSPTTGGVASSRQLLAGLDDVLLSSLGGSQGLSDLGSISITDRSGTSDTIDLSAATTIGDVIEAINSSSANVLARFDGTKTGIEIIDQTGQTTESLQISNSDGTNTATQLGIEASVAEDSVSSGSLNRLYVNRNTLLSELNNGTGVSLGSIELTDSSGANTTLNLLSSRPETVGELIDAINGAAVSVEAKLNDTGDGIVIVDTADGEGTLSISDVGTATAAAQLGIAGTATSQTVGGETVSAIDGSQTLRLTTSSTQTISELVDEINGLESTPVNANLLTVGGGVRLVLSSASSGSAGRVAVDGGDSQISFSQTAEAQDALLSFGSSAEGGILISSSTNTFSEVVEGLELTVNDVSDNPVTISVSPNQDNVSRQIDTFVGQFNALRDKLDELTVFDETTNSVGLLFGKNSALRVDLAYGNFFSTAIRDAGSIRSLGEVGLRLNESGKLEFDRSKFQAAYEKDPAAVEEFFTKEDTGFSARAKAVADSLAGVDNGALLNRTQVLESQIAQNNQRISAFDVRLDRQRERLLKQFFDMETAIAKLQTNLTALNQLQVIPPLSTSSA